MLWVFVGVVWPDDLSWIILLEVRTGDHFFCDEVGHLGRGLDPHARQCILVKELRFLRHGSWVVFWKVQGTFH